MCHMYVKYQEVTHCMTLAVEGYAVFVNQWIEGWHDSMPFLAVSQNYVSNITCSNTNTLSLHNQTV